MRLKGEVEDQAKESEKGLPARRRSRRGGIPETKCRKCFRRKEVISSLKCSESPSKTRTER